jgi:hypothetical protein
VKVILPLIVIAVLVIVLGSWLSWMNNHNRRVSLGLGGSKKQIADLQTDSTRYREALHNIKALAETNRAIFNDPIWDLVATKAQDALYPEEKK